MQAEAQSSPSSQPAGKPAGRVQGRPPALHSPGIAGGLKLQPSPSGRPPSEGRPDQALISHGNPPARWPLREVAQGAGPLAPGRVGAASSGPGTFRPGHGALFQNHGSWGNPAPVGLQNAAQNAIQQGIPAGGWHAAGNQGLHPPTFHPRPQHLVGDRMEVAGRDSAGQNAMSNTAQPVGWPMGTRHPSAAVPSGSVGLAAVTGWGGPPPQVIRGAAGAGDSWGALGDRHGTGWAGPPSAAPTTSAADSRSSTNNVAPAPPLLDPAEELCARPPPFCHFRARCVVPDVI